MVKTKSAIPIFHGRKWPVGLSNASKRIGVTSGHLHQVLTGKRESKRVTEEYNALVAELKGGAA